MSHRRLEILRGIEAELAKASREILFRVARREREGAVWKVFVDVDAGGYRGGGLDESLEGAKAWWPGPPKGIADVLSVIPEEGQINLRFANATPPGPGETIRIYPPRYLESLRHAWSDANFARRSLAWLDLVARGGDEFDRSRVLDVPPLTGQELRRRQAEAFRLPGWGFGFLWGPPGTGKTTTLGALLAAYAVRFPSDRVLLLSTTNLAVDQALVAVDRALEPWARRSAVAARARAACARLGSHFQGKSYEGREHLLPVKDPKLVRQLVEAEAKQPPKEDVKAFDEWRRRVDATRAAMREEAREVLRNARIAAMTTTRAAFTLDVLAEVGPYDLIVFDEASQVGQAHALALLPLGRRAIFAGDPKQLAPIVTSDDPAALRWLGESMFREMRRDAPSTCLLDEQSRMAAPICRVVSEVFYDGQLVVAGDCERRPEWKAERRLASVPPLGDAAAGIVMVEEESVWSAKYHGYIRYASAEKVRDLVSALSQRRDQADILVLTPFRAQRTLIRQFLRHAGLSKAGVSTVHRAQGSERHTIVFDPVQGDCDFLKTPDAPRLINVALSRAKARLVLCMGPADFRNEHLRRIAHAIDRQELHGAAIPIGELIALPGFPCNALGKLVRTAKFSGRVIELPKGQTKLAILAAETGVIEAYSVAALKERYQGKISSSTRIPASVPHPRPGPTHEDCPEIQAALLSRGQMPPRMPPPATSGPDQGSSRPTSQAIPGQGKSTPPIPPITPLKRAKSLRKKLAERRGVKSRPLRDRIPVHKRSIGSAAQTHPASRASVDEAAHPVPPVQRDGGEHRPHPSNEVHHRLAQLTALDLRSIASVLTALGELARKHLREPDLGRFVIPGIAKLTLIHKPAIEARQVIDPPTGQIIHVRAKPARDVVKAVPLAALKGLVQGADVAQE